MVLLKVKQIGGINMIKLIILILVGLIGLLHLGIAGMEMLGSPELQSNAFDMPLDYVKMPNTRLALGNQGIYNAMLGLIMILTIFLVHGPDLNIILALEMIFVMVVGLYGAVTVTTKIFFIQFLPAFITGVLLFFVGE